MEYELTHHMLLTYMIFWLGYFRFWLDLSLVILSFLPLYFKRVYLHGDPIEATVLSAVT